MSSREDPKESPNQQMRTEIENVIQKEEERIDQLFEILVLEKMV